MEKTFLTDEDKRQLEAKIGGKAPTGHKHSVEDIGGIIAIEHGGTGAKTAGEALKNLGGARIESGVISSTNSTSFSFALSEAPKIVFFNYYGVQGMAGYFGDAFSFLVKQGNTYVGVESTLDGRNHEETTTTLNFFRGSYSDGILTVTKSTLNNHSGAKFYYYAVM